MLTVPILGIPALLLAGLVASPHCALMCAAWQPRGGAGLALLTQAGRLLGYTLLGAAAGTGGAWLLRGAQALGTADTLRALALPLMLLLAWRRTAPRAPCCARGSTSPRQAWAAFGAGMANALVPCGLLYAAATYAALSGSAVQGALLLLAFGLGSLPALHLAGRAWAGLPRVRRRGPRRLAFALAVLCCGLAALPVASIGTCLSRTAG